jgi:alkylated DNA repair dioxygenase AlkB
VAQLQFFGEVAQTLQGGVTYQSNFIDLAEADRIFAALDKLEWGQHVYAGSGTAPRKYAWMGVPYTSPNLVSKIVVTPWTPEAKYIKELVEEKVGCGFDSLNLNRYDNHRDSIGWHSDGSGEGLWTFPIASVSLGAPRRFKWQSKKDGGVTTQVLEHGSLLIMPPGFQRDYLHALPKQDKVCGPRINLTFRRKAR